MDVASILAIFTALLTPLTGLAVYIAAIYRRRIAALEASLAESQKREKRIVGVLLRGAEDDEQLVGRLASVITQESDRGGGRGDY